MDDLVEQEKKRGQEDRETWLNDPKVELEQRLEKGDPVRKTRGRLVGIVCLSDILRYVIGASADQGKDGVGAGAGIRSRRTSVASSAPSQ